MDLEEQKKLEHQLELATRVAAYVNDENDGTTTQTLCQFAGTHTEASARIKGNARVK